ncbi:hypothetical protein N7495_003264 [Penicillium taxi]|uniref:uncharacterized protein n=1 Tax=Penicillium taxi TaxID=168475 RepID=UPI0025455B7C|nr:uncharacterized protein N7495_003264 [Penicillium taxi]KAJ5902736.1 hypothetical protein N7495_003264 [Penicillium taxi]
MQCAFFPVVRSVQAQVLKGIYSERILDEWTDCTPVKAEENPLTDEQSLDGNYIMLLRPPWGLEKGMEYNQTFGIGPLGASGINRFLWSLLTGNVFEVDDGAYSFTNEIINTVALGANNGCGKTDASQLECVLTNIAKSISTSIRDSTYTQWSELYPAGETSGQAFTNISYVAVHWPWIISPVLVCILGLVSLFGTMWKSQRCDIPKWKNDPYPLLFLYEENRSSGDECAKSEKVTRVKLCRDGDQ